MKRQQVIDPFEKRQCRRKEDGLPREDTPSEEDDEDDEEMECAPEDDWLNDFGETAELSTGASRPEGIEGGFVPPVTRDDTSGRPASCPKVIEETSEAWAVGTRPARTVASPIMTAAPDSGAGTSLPPQGVMKRCGPAHHRGRGRDHGLRGPGNGETVGGDVSVPPHRKRAGDGGRHHGIGDPGDDGPFQGP